MPRVSKKILVPVLTIEQIKAVCTEYPWSKNERKFFRVKTYPTNEEVGKFVKHMGRLKLRFILAIAFIDREIYIQCLEVL
jgi:hypothetical protein